MKKNSKGFTLVELIGVIAILGLVITLSSIMIINIRKNVLQKDYDNLKTYLEVQAAEYASKTFYKTVSVQDLIDSGYVKPDNQTDVLNPIDNSSMNCYILEATFKNGEYVAELKEDLANPDGTCKEYNKFDSDLEICHLNEESDDCRRIGKDDWFNTDIILAVRYPNGNLVGDAIYKWTSTKGESSTDQTIKATALSVSQDVYSVDITKDNLKGTVSQKINIDKQAPTIISGKINTGWASKKTLTIEATDSGSGIAGYSVVKENEACGNFKNQNTYEITTEGTYKYCVIDKAGNVSSQTISIDKIDSSILEKPTISASDGLTQDKWHHSDFTLTFNSKVDTNKSEVKYYYGLAENNINVNGTSLKIDASYNNKTIYVRACNEAGICSEVNSYKVRYDNTPPTYTSGGSLGNGSLSKPTYSDNNGGSGGVSVYVCVTSGGVPSVNDSCFTTTSSTFSTTCGVTYKLYSYAVDAAGNKSSVYDHSKASGSYYRSCPSYSYDDDDDDRYHSSGSSNTKKEPTCDTTCQMQKNSEKWWDCTTDKCRDDLHEENKKLAEQNSDCKGNCNFNGGDGSWRDSNGNKLYGDSGNSKTSSSNKSSSSSSSSKGSSSSNKWSSNRTPVTEHETYFKIPNFSSTGKSLSSSSTKGSSSKKYYF